MPIGHCFILMYKIFMNIYVACVFLFVSLGIEISVFFPCKRVFL